MSEPATALSSEMVSLIELHGLSDLLRALSSACAHIIAANPDTIQATAYGAALPYLEEIAGPLAEIGL